MRIRIGSRGSALALAQTNAVAQKLRRYDHEVEVVIIQTAGDRDKHAKFADIGAPGVFVREIEAALLGDEIDLAVHSYKDLPSKSPRGLVVAAVPERVDAADRLVIRREFVTPGAELEGDAGGEALFRVVGEAPPRVVGDALPLVEGAVVGTSSERRRALLRSLRPDLQLERIRGNVPTRLQKLRQGPYHAIILAAAGLLRLERDPDAPPLGLDELVRIRLDPAVFVPAPAQGAIALQCRDDDPVAEVLAPLHDTAADLPVRAEREILRLVDGGCSLPFGAWARIDDGGCLELFAVIEAGDRLLRASDRGGSPEELAGRVWRAMEEAAGDAADGQRAEAASGVPSRDSGAAE